MLINFRFVDRDMMMRFLGWGIGHCNSQDFPHEANALLASNEDRELVQHRDNITPADNLEAEVGEEADDGDGDGDMDADADIDSAGQPLDMYQY
jgi:hypothetical protein